MAVLSLTLIVTFACCESRFAGAQGIPFSLLIEILFQTAEWRTCYSKLFADMCTPEAGANTAQQPSGFHLSSYAVHPISVLLIALLCAVVAEGSKILVKIWSTPVGSCHFLVNAVIPFLNI
jgi:hypothetical protein